jgi:uncharacterized membrane protein
MKEFNLQEETIRVLRQDLQTLRTQNERLREALERALPKLHGVQYQEAKTLLAGVKPTSQPS